MGRLVYRNGGYEIFGFRFKSGADVEKFYDEAVKALPNARGSIAKKYNGTAVDKNRPVSDIIGKLDPKEKA